MGDLIDKIPEILEKSGSLFGIFALAAIFLAIFLFRNAGTKKKKRIFIYLTFFLLAFVFSALTAGIYSGFEIGIKAKTTQIEHDPLQVQLSPAMVEKIEDHIATNGGTITGESKFQILAEAVDAYLAPPDASSSELIDSPSSTTQPYELNTTQSEEVRVEDFLFELQGCSRIDDQIACDLKVTNNENDEKLRLHANYLARASKIVTPQGIQFIADMVELGGYKNTSYVDVNLVQGVSIGAKIDFEPVPELINHLALIELSVSARNAGAFTVQFRNITISN